MSAVAGELTSLERLRDHRRRWDGQVTLANREAMAERLRHVLAGRRFAVMRQRLYPGHCDGYCPDAHLKVSQRLDTSPGQWCDGREHGETGVTSAERTLESPDPCRMAEIAIAVHSAIYYLHGTLEDEGDSRPARPRWNTRVTFAPSQGMISFSVPSPADGSRDEYTIMTEEEGA